MSESKTDAARGREGETMNGAAGGALGCKPELLITEPLRVNQGGSQ